jgi:hypothetical protein
MVSKSGAVIPEKAPSKVAFDTPLFIATGRKPASHFWNAASADAVSKVKTAITAARKSMHRRIAGRDFMKRSVWLQGHGRHFSGKPQYFVYHPPFGKFVVSRAEKQAARR